MISHDLKAIFIHIPRTGGTSVETALVGNNWWKIHPQTKHLNWQDAKREYSEYWDDYFKFTIIRNPWDWLASLYFSHGRGGKKSWEEYVHNPNLYPHEQSTMSQSKIIGDEMDFMLRYETLNEDFICLCQKLSVSKTLPQVQIGDGTHQNYSELYTEELVSVVKQTFAEDIKRFNYKFKDKSVAEAQNFKSEIFNLKQQIATLEHELKLAKQGFFQRNLNQFWQWRK